MSRGPIDEMSVQQQQPEQASRGVPDNAKELSWGYFQCMMCDGNSGTYP
jgi:hypothetical protein